MPPTELNKTFFIFFIWPGKVYIFVECQFNAELGGKKSQNGVIIASEE